MRHTIVKENTNTPHGYYLNSGSIKWSDKPIPVVSMNDVSKVISFATDIRREKNEITAEIDLIFDEDLFHFAIQADSIELNPEPEDQDVPEVTDCRLRLVSLVPRYPGILERRKPS